MITSHAAVTHTRNDLGIRLTGKGERTVRVSAQFTASVPVLVYTSSHRLPRPRLNGSARHFGYSASKLPSTVARRRPLVLSVELNCVGSTRKTRSLKLKSLLTKKIKIFFARERQREREPQSTAVLLKIHHENQTSKIWKYDFSPIESCRVRKSLLTNTRADTITRFS